MCPWLLSHSRVTLQPSSKTSFVVLGENAGPSKLAAIKKHGLRTLSEDEFLELIGTRVGPSGVGGAGSSGASALDEKARKKMEKDEQAIKNAAKEMEKREKKVAKEQAKAGRWAIDPYFRDRPSDDVGGQFQTRLIHPALDSTLCPAESQGDMREQGTNREATTMATRLVCNHAHFLRLSLIIHTHDGDTGQRAINHLSRNLENLA